MDFPYTIDSARNVAIVRVSGTVRGSDITETFERLYNDALWKYGLDMLWDGTKITELLLEKEDMPGFLALHQRYAAVVGPGRTVVIVARPVDHMMAKIYAVMSAKAIRPVQVCRTESEAWEILRRAPS